METVKVKYRLSSREVVAHIVIDDTNLKVYGKGEWKPRKRGKENRHI
ncbi:Mobile element protein [Candidatus Enterovibrio escicola]|uniref:Mobile element protein n=1 Tax=Candidatus Enterovibrio escicola TaxID=1927127 RepID=A0A2A5T2H7_9GAMM|nr:Mobile element protein [Candidatus Enterovibrio escacola]